MRDYISCGVCVHSFFTRVNKDEIWDCQLGHSCHSNSVYNPCKDASVDETTTQTFGPLKDIKPNPPAQTCHKDIEGKPDLLIVDDYFPRALVALGEIAVQAVEDYGYNTFDQVALDEYKKALRRHQVAQARGEVYDQKSGKPHSWHIAANAMIIVEIEERMKK